MNPHITANRDTAPLPLPAWRKLAGLTPYAWKQLPDPFRPHHIRTGPRSCVVAESVAAWSARIAKTLEGRRADAA